MRREAQRIKEQQQKESNFKDILQKTASVVSEAPDMMLKVSDSMLNDTLNLLEGRTPIKAKST